MATYVLVHGTGSGGWLWEPVAERLREAGHTVPHPRWLVWVSVRAKADPRRISQRMSNRLSR